MPLLRQILRIFVLGSLVLGPAAAELSVRECHMLTDSRDLDLTTRDVLRLPAHSGFRTLGTLKTRVSDPSDQVVQASVWLAPGSSSGSLLELELRIDDRVGGRSTRRVPGELPHTRTLRAFFSDLAAGEKAIELRGRNLSGQPVDLLGFWISPLILPAELSTHRSHRSDPVRLDSSWRVLAEVQTSTPEKPVLASVSLTLAKGTTRAGLDYRIVGPGGSELIGAVVPERLPDGHALAAFLPGSSLPAPGRYRVEARADAPVEIRSRGLVVQTLPDLPVLQGSLTEALVIPSDGNRYRVAASDLRLLGPEARGSCGQPGSSCDGRSTHGWGWSQLLLAEGGPGEAKAWLRLVGEDGAALWCPPGCGPPPCNPTCRPGDVGIMDFAAAGAPRFEDGPAVWQHVGLPRDEGVRAVFELHGVCPSNGPGIPVKKARFQLLVLPDNLGSGATQQCHWNESLLREELAGAERACFATGDRSVRVRGVEVGRGAEAP